MAVDFRSRMILLVLWVALTFSVVSSIRNPMWQDQWDASRTLYDLSDKEQKNIEDDCNNTDGQCDIDKGKELLKLIDTNEIPYKRRPNSHLSNVEKLMQMETKSGIIPYFHTSSLPLPCSCGAHYRLMDLGRAFYPRYLPTAVCDPAACGALGTYHCRPRPYHVRVLRRKDITTPAPEQDPDQVANPPLPEILRTNWVLETFTVTVACECGP